MRQRRTVEEPPPPRTDRPLRQVVLCLTITYGLALAIALALPRADIAPLISIVVPVIAVALTVAFAWLNSPAYVTTETGVVTMIIMVLLAGYLLTRRAADFVKAEPNSPQPIARSRAAA